MSWKQRLKSRCQGLSLSELELCALGDLIEFQRGYDLPKDDFVAGPYPVQSSNGILGYHNDFKVRGPSITIGRSGTVGIPHLLEDSFFPHNTTLFVKDFKGNDIRYIYYLLKVLRLGDKKSGSGVPTMNRNHLHPLKIKSFRNIDYQKKLSYALYTIDKKIELNRRINAELEAMAKLIYDYWFVQFDFPNENGEPYKSSGGKMVYNEVLKREIPADFSVQKIKNIIEVKDGTHDTPKASKSSFFLVTSNGLKAEGIDFNAAYTITENDFDKINKRSLVQTDDILFSMIGSVGEIYLVDEKLINFAIKNIGLYKTSEKKEYREYILMSLKSVYMERYLKLSTIGSIQKFIGLGTLRDMPLLVNKRVIEKYRVSTEPIFQKMSLIKSENKDLTELRDWLLPMLMNGQVTIK
jgi:type I restriction enzyme S subunit